MHGSPEGILKNSTKRLIEGFSLQPESDYGYEKMGRDELIRLATDLRTELVKTKEQLRLATEKCFIDALTGCYNRNYYEKFKDDNFNPTRSHKRIGLIFFDINDLKFTNDSRGHDEGDRLIVKTANHLLMSCRKDDTIIRLGGDEFLVICANSENDENFEENLFLLAKCDISPQAPTSIAYGVAVFDKDQDTGIGDTKRRAGHSMYECKKAMKTKL